MELTSLTALSPLDGRYANKLTSLTPITSEYGLIYFRLVVEVRWLITLTEHPEIPEAAPLTQAQRDRLEALISGFSAQDASEIKNIEKTTNHDVKAVEYFIQSKLSEDETLKKLIPFIHFACTSEDINNLAYALMLKDALNKVIQPTLKQISDNLSQQSERYAELAMLARTHGQTASPTTLGKEFANVVARLQRQQHQLEQQTILGKFNGAVGNYNAHHCAYPTLDWPNINARFVESLGLDFNPMTTQIEPHDYVAELLQTIGRANTILLDLSRDIWAYISIGYFKQTTVKDEVGSSTMPHKVNPIDFENAEGNLGIANALTDHLAHKLPISRWQRDLSDSTALRNLGSVMGYTLLAYQALLKGLNKITANEQRIQQDLNNSWEVLAEPLQTIMRRYGICDAYEQLKAFTRGKAITAECIQAFIDQLDLPTEALNILKNLTPENYIGYAVSLTQKMSNNKKV